MSKKLITIEVEGEHIAWKNELNAAIEELNHFEDLLSAKSTQKSDKKVEHFQNQFLIQKNAISKLKNEIRKHDFAIQRSGDKPFDSVNDEEASFHEDIGKKIEIELNILKELKQEFNQFLAN